MNNLNWQLFRWNGRLGRGDYWIALLVVAILFHAAMATMVVSMMVLILLGMDVTHAFLWLFTILLAFTTALLHALATKRLQDAGALILLAVFLAALPFVLGAVGVVLRSYATIVTALLAFAVIGMLSTRKARDAASP